MLGVPWLPATPTCEIPQQRHIELGDSRRHVVSLVQQRCALLPLVCHFAVQLTERVVMAD